MRVTQQMINRNFLTSLHQNLSRMEKSQYQLSTGKIINKPSDDPVGLSYSLRYRSELNANEQYQRNTDSALSWLEFQDTAIHHAVEVLQRARELAIKGGTETNTQSAMDAIAAEVDELFNQMLDIANSKFNGKYVFNGQRTDQPPYPDDNSYLISDFDNGDISFELSRGIVIKVNVNAGNVFGEAGDVDNIFATLRELSDSLRAGDATTAAQQIGNFNTRMDKMLDQWSDLGAKTNRIELIEHRLKDGNINLNGLISKTEDADMAELITKLKTEENVYQASLSVGARIIRPSLIDFLR